VPDNAFTRYGIGVDTGTEVTFDFVGAIAHDVSFDDGVASPEMVSGSYRRTFDEPGVYDFACTIHPSSMRGRVIAADSRARR
jgi:plastocyanin